MKLKILTLAIGIFAQISISSAIDPFTDSLNRAPDNWYNLDPLTNQVQGVSTEKTYQILADRKGEKVTVAVIDSGVDIEHEDLQGKLWINQDEVAGNGIDDDQNGYVDDVYGWNFIGGSEGDHVNYDTYELTREYARLKEKYQNINPDDLPKKERAYFEKIEQQYETKQAEAQQEYQAFTYFHKNFTRSQKLMEAYLDVDSLTAQDVRNMESSDEIVLMAKGFMEYAFENGLDESLLEEGIEHYRQAVDYGYNLEYNPRTIVGDNYEDISEKFYGNNDVTGPDSRHGTHVAGIIAADRHNNLGTKGIADHVEIMAIRAVPNGDERDKDVANAIYYAVDNGAQIINMSFGKSFSPNKSIVDEAVRYAEEKGVLIIHAAGNSSENIDETDNFPSKIYENKKPASNWIEVGASSWKGQEDFVATFSNYGKRSVDVFAPGVDVFSTTPNQGYESLSGTSMAAPVTAGIAALLMSYYPDLDATQVKEIILSSVVKLDGLKVNCPGKSDKQINFSNLSSTGGVVNAFEAVKLAESYKINRKK
ncbi:S8 family peptidase [Tunicatimonas pelagia]|uniref:S8 family peptidase n=1 Tax=Tunicatimonas pelagia TaxID=931531 RepID=UPI002666722B|nr:S8 family serine peptidase [Tunicatimonas pelagia]WKN42413.1 S8 family serine peptidase [Tunicatimonas pelagia]